ncbi:hypothetical protein GGR95_002841 [Sulfitobacter undariae]|uniref:PIN like domain-containing protein n=1 Tax=Sulfitobacter undariae TaxID=1563671 RepID=A0A7W6ECD0_9RHOB|nr:PIN domain-containing protein [Sulfitobacter undariae]MBB3995189.1 hypothetical protein [Sulfitobacter undariae]
MKGQFPQFDPGAAVDYKAIWETALFVFDTNVLLNLYRYQASTRDQLLDILGKLSERIWIPHHVALEFQRNRFTVLADQNKRFSEVQNVVSKAKDGLRIDLEKLQLERRHSLIDPAPLVDGFDLLANTFLASLEEIQRDQQKLTEPDPLKDKIETLFSGRVGPEVSKQAEIDTIYSSAEKRYQLEIPPGYLDANKDKSGPAEYVHSGVNYKRKYGDFLIWHQLLSYAKEQGIQSVVFVTDDAKDDWWWKVKSDGPKTLGPRPELRDEASRVGGISQFNMYKPEGFLRYSKEFMKSDISNEAIQEVRDVSSVRTENVRRHRDMMNRARGAERAVHAWLIKHHGQVDANQRGYPDFTVKLNGGNIGFEVKLISHPKFIGQRAREFVHQAHYEATEGDLDGVTIVLVTENESDATELINRWLSKWRTELPITVSLLVGVLDMSESGDGSFVPFAKMSADETNIM